MTVSGFILLLVAAIVGITVGAHFAEGFTPPGLQRTFAVGVIAAAIVFPAAKFGEWCGWIRGRLDLTGDGARGADGEPRRAARPDGVDGGSRS
jgi:hypothetical protein